MGLYDTVYFEKKFAEEHGIQDLEYQTKDLDPAMIRYLVSDSIYKLGWNRETKSYDRKIKFKDPVIFGAYDIDENRVHVNVTVIANKGRTLYVEVGFNNRCCIIYGTPCPKCRRADGLYSAGRGEILCGFCKYVVKVT